MDAEFDKPLRAPDLVSDIQQPSDGWLDLDGDAITADDDGGDDIPEDAPEPEPEKIAGVTPCHISDQIPHHYEHKEYDYTEHLGKRHESARNRFGRQGFNGYSHGNSDSRIAGLEVWDNPRDGESNHNTTSSFFLLNDSLLERIRAAVQQKGAELTTNELLRLGLAETEGAVQPDFAAGAINAVNRSYFSSEVAFLPETRLSNVFARNVPLNQAIGAALARESGTPEHLRIKELCSGSRNAHWEYEAAAAEAAGSVLIDVTLTDFVRPDVDPLAYEGGAIIRVEQYSLFDDMPDLPAEKRFDAMVATYGFDSVWQDEDIRLREIDGQWYQSLYRVKVADWNPRRDELVQALRDGVPLPNAKPHEYDGIFVEKAMEPYDISNHPFAQQIEEHGRETTQVPGGLVKRVVNAFESQLGENGVFMSCDVGDFGIKKDGFGVGDQGVSGVAARYRGDDYQLAKKILEEVYGLDVRLISLEDLVRGNLPAGWEGNATPTEIDEVTNTPSNGAMIVKRRQQPSILKGLVERLRG